MQLDITQLTELVKVLLDANPVNLMILCVAGIVFFVYYGKDKRNAAKDEKKDQ
ncbi:MAG: hypothetical protein ACTIH5_11385 [Lactococcus cremoris]